MSAKSASNLDRLDFMKWGLNGVRIFIGLSNEH
jgi:hypothetical protein